MSDTANWVTRNRDWFVPYLAYVQEEMGLTHWEIKLVMERPDDLEGDVDMAVQMHNHYQSTKLYVSDKKRTPELVREEVVHEFLHLHLRDWWVAALSATQMMSKSAGVMYEDRLEHEMEKVIDAMAVAWARRIDIPREVSDGS